MFYFAIHVMRTGCSMFFLSWVPLACSNRAAYIHYCTVVTHSSAGIYQSVLCSRVTSAAGLAVWGWHESIGRGVGMHCLSSSSWGDPFYSLFDVWRKKTKKSRQKSRATTTQQAAVPPWYHINYKAFAQHSDV